MMLDERGERPPSGAEQNNGQQKRLEGADQDGSAKPPKSKTDQEQREEQGAAEKENEEYDDQYYAPDFIMQLVEHPPLWDTESKEDFMNVFDSFDFDYPNGRAKTDTEYLLVYQATMLTWELLRYDRMKSAIVNSQLRPAAEGIYRKTYQDVVGDGDPCNGLSTQRKWARNYFADPEYRKAFAAKLETTGYGRGAIESEAFLRALPSLSLLERMITGAQKRLLNILKRMDACYAGRDREEPMARSNAARRYEDKLDEEALLARSQRHGEEHQEKPGVPPVFGENKKKG